MVQPLSSLSQPQRLRTAPAQHLGTAHFLGIHEVARYQLSNGLQLLLLRDPAVPVVAFQTWYKVGSRDETPGITGMAHLFEHLMFKETQQLPEGAFSRVLEEAGARDLNAWTWCDMTVYTQSVPKQYLELVLKLESDRMQNLLLNERQLAAEREVVLNERLMTTEDDPFGRIGERLSEVAFDVHPYRWPVIGAREDVENVTLDQVLDFYHRYYAPNNAVIILCGDFELEPTLQLFEQHYGSIPASHISRPERQQESPRSAQRRTRLELQLESSLLVAGFMVPGLTHPDRAALSLLDAILVQGRASRLVRALINSGIAGNVQGMLLPLSDPSLYELEVTLQQGRTLEEAEAVLLEVINTLQRDGVTTDELERARQKYLADSWMELRDLNGRANFMGLYELAFGDFEHGLLFLKSLEQVTVEEVQRVARQYLILENSTVLEAVPLAGAEADVEGAAELEGAEEADATDSESDSAGLLSAEDDPSSIENDEDEAASADAEAEEALHQPLGLDALGFANQDGGLPLTPWPIEKSALPNGGTLVWVAQPALPLVHLSLYIPGGMALEQSGEEGLANLLGDMLLRGTQTLSRERFEEALDGLGASLDILSETDHLRVVASTLASNFGALMTLLRDALTQPLLEGEELERLRLETLAAQREIRNDDKSLTDQWFSRILLGEHPYGRSSLGTEASIKSVSREQLVGAHRRMVHREGLLMGVSGALSRSQVESEVEALLQALPTLQDGIPDPRQLPELPADYPVGVLTLIDKPERGQTQVQLGMRGVSASHADQPLLILGSFAFGGSLSTTRLMLEVREKRGWSYGAAARFDMQRVGGTFNLWAMPTAEDCVDCLALVMQMLQALVAEGITEQELSYARRAILNSAAFDEETADRCMRGVLSRQWLGIDRQVTLERIQSATLDEVNAALRRALPLEQLMGVMVCTADVMKPALESRGLFSRIEVLPYDAP